MNDTIQVTELPVEVQTEVSPIHEGLDKVISEEIAEGTPVIATEASAS